VNGSRLDGLMTRVALAVGLVSGLAWIALPAGPSAAASTSGAPIVIGNIGEYTVPGYDIDEPGAAPIEAWAKWVNAHGGINGHPVKLITMNTEGNQATAVSDVEQLVGVDHVVALVGAEDPPLYLGYQSYIDKMKIPVLGGGIYTATPWDKDPMFYPQGATDTAEAEAAVTYTKKIGLKRIGEIACSGVAQCTDAITSTRNLAKSAGLDFVYGANPSSNTSNYTANCLAAEAAGAQIIELSIATSVEGATIAQDCAQQNYHPDWIIPGEAIASGYLSPSFNNAFNFSITQPWYSTAPVMKDFQAAMKEYTHIDFNTVELPLEATDAWASGLMFQKAVQLSGVTGVPTSADILAGLKKFKNQTLGGFIGPVTFTNPKDKIGNCFFVTTIKSSKFVQGNKGTYVCNPS
jgi:branched-chain amino acid transport system substrate-binding protein